MRVPLSWLKDYVKIDRPVAEVDTILTNAGLEVKTIDYIGIPGAGAGSRPIISLMVLFHFIFLSFFSFL